MSTPTIQTCGSCRFYFTGQGRSWCRRYPPFPEDRRHSRYPTVHWDDSCGEHAPRITTRSVGDVQTEVTS
jgi:hypothetical protein